MLLAVDVGNTQTVFGVFDRERLAEHWRAATEADRTADELGALLARLLELRDLGFEDISGVCLSSTVPQLVRSYGELADRYLAAGTRSGTGWHTREYSRAWRQN